MNEVARVNRLKKIPNICYTRDTFGVNTRTFFVPWRLYYLESVIQEKYISRSGSYTRTWYQELIWLKDGKNDVFMLSQIAVFRFTIYRKNSTPWSPWLYSKESFLKFSLCFVYPKQGKHTDSDEDLEAGREVMVLDLWRPRAFVTPFDDLRSFLCKESDSASEPEERYAVLTKFFQIVATWTQQASTVQPLFLVNEVVWPNRLKKIPNIGYTRDTLGVNTRTFFVPRRLYYLESVILEK